MPVYEYTALDRSGKTITGIIDADSTVAARQKLRGSGRYPVAVKETLARSGGEASWLQSFRGFFDRVRPEEIHAVTRQLATLLGAGLPLVAALDALIHQTSTPPLKRVVSQLKESVNEGNSFTFALSRHPKLFSNIYINMVRAGEASGSLDVVLERLAEFGESQQILQGRFKAALIYPVFMALIGSGILFFLVTYVVPNITQIFVEMEQVLPLPTMLLIGFSGFMRSYWWLVALMLAGGAIALRQWIGRPRGRAMWDGLKLRAPVFGGLHLHIGLARFARTLGSLLQSGVPLITALGIVRNILDNVLLAEIVDEAIVKVQEGENLSSFLGRSRWFPPMFVQMIAVGEQSGALEAMLEKVATAYEKESETRVIGLTAMIEPLMIMMMGLIVGFIVVSILLPIFEMNQMVK